MSDQVVSLRVKQLGSERAAALLRGGGHDRRPEDGTVVCRGCATVARLDSDEVCCWWPFGCQTRRCDPYPRLCWACCDEHERVDLVDAGCVLAALRRRGELW